MQLAAGKQMRLVLKALKAAFSVRALAALLGAGIGFGAEVTHWLETGTWGLSPRARENGPPPTRTLGGCAMSNSVWFGKLF